MSTAASARKSPALDGREVRLPTPKELELAYQALRAATEAVAGVAWHVREVAATVNDEERPEFEAPKLELIGRLYVYAQDCYARLDEMRGYVDDVPGNLIMLEELRERLADPEAW